MWALLEAAELRHFVQRQTIMREGDESDCLYIVVAGRVTVTASRGKRFLLLATLEHPAPLGEIGAFSGKPRTATATAETDCVLIRLDRHAAIAALRLAPESWEGVARWFAEFAHSKGQAEKDAMRDLRARLARLLLALGDPKTGQIKASQRELAEMLGTHRGAIQHHIEAFRTAGFITGSGAIAILDRAALAREGE